MTARDNDFTYNDGVSLRDYFEARLVAIEKAVEVADAANNKRLDGMNEFREALRDQNVRFTTCVEFAALRDQVQEMKETAAEVRGKASQTSVFIAYGIALLSIVISLIGLIVHIGM